MLIRAPSCVQRTVLLERQFGPWPLERSNESTFGLIPSCTGGWTDGRGPCKLWEQAKGPEAWALSVPRKRAFGPHLHSYFRILRQQEVLFPGDCPFQAPFPRRNYKGSLRIRVQAPGPRGWRVLAPCFRAGGCWNDGGLLPKSRNFT